MMCVEKVISRGTVGAELEALVIARLCGVPTGGSTRIFRGLRTSGVIHRYGLSADDCSRRQAMLRNIRQAQGTLVFGRFGRATESLLKNERTKYCCIERLREDAVARVVAWLRRNDIRTLNIIGRSETDATFLARVVMLEVLQALGRRPSLPTARTGPMRGMAAIAVRDTCYAVVAWPTQAAWRWRERTTDWEPVIDWKALAPLRGSELSLAWLSRAVWKALPGQIRRWVTIERPGHGPYVEDEVLHDLDLLEVLGRLGKPAEDLARAGRWAILRLLDPQYSARASAERNAVGWGSSSALVTRRQRDIVSAFGFPATESTVRILAKLSRDSCTIDVLEQLQVLVCDPVSRRVLQSLPRVNRAVALVLSDPWLRQLVGRRLLHQIGSRAGEESRGVNGITFMLHCLQEEAARGRALDGLSVNSLRSLERVWNELPTLLDVYWPAPSAPLPGITGVIEPLTGGASLWMEGREMRHCAAQYATEVRLGRCLMFRLLPKLEYGTGRATLQLRAGPQGLWRVAQLKGAGNAPVEPGTVRFVNTWLFFAQCDPAVGEDELSRSCIAELHG